jgi:hypothetical protein
VRARSLKPGFFKNDQLAALPPLTRILFAGLWCLCDRSGRFEDRPAKIKAEVLPYDSCNVNKMLDALAAGDDPFILRYCVENARYIAVLNFPKHQNPHVNERPSTIPAPESHSASTVPNTKSHSINIADSGLLTPDSLTEETGVPISSGAIAPLETNEWAGVDFGEDEKPEEEKPRESTPPVQERPPATPAKKPVARDPPPETAGTIVAFAADHEKAAGRTVTQTRLDRIGAAAKPLLAGGADSARVREAVARLLDDNKPPGDLEYLVGDLERGGGNGTGRARAARSRSDGRSDGTSF